MTTQTDSKSPDDRGSASSRCSPSLREDLDCLAMWTDQWASDQAEVDEVSPCDEEERKVIKATQRILRACEDRYRVTCVTDRDYGGRWCPEVCPFTLAPFFMWLEHPEKGWLPTYGGPFDSYTIPEPDMNGTCKRIDREYVRYRYDHDDGGWLLDECEVVDLRVVAEETLIELDAWRDAD